MSGACKSRNSSSESVGSSRAVWGFLPQPPIPSPLCCDERPQCHSVGGRTCGRSTRSCEGKRFDAFVRLAVLSSRSPTDATNTSTGPQQRASTEEVRRAVAGVLQMGAALSTTPPQNVVLVQWAVDLALRATTFTAARVMFPRGRGACGTGEIPTDQRRFDLRSVKIGQMRAIIPPAIT